MEKGMYLFLIPLVMIACQSNEGVINVPSNISGVKATPDTGSVIIYWDIPADSNLVYVKVRYKKYPDHPDTSRTISSWASI